MSSNKTFLFPMVVPHVYLEVISISPERRTLAGWALPAIARDATVLQVFSIEVIEEPDARVPVFPGAFLMRLAPPVVARAASSDNGWLCWLLAFT